MGDSIYSEYKNSSYDNIYSGNYTYGSNFLDKYSYGSPFIDETSGDLREKDNSVIAKRIPEFVTIPFELIGLVTKR